MSFHEKTAWVMSVLLTLAGGFYAFEVIGRWGAEGVPPPPSIKLAIVYVAIVVIGAIVSFSAVAANNADEANAPMDERERLISDRAGNWSGIILGGGILIGAAHYFVGQHGDLFFHTVIAALMISQIAEYVLQIVLHRVGV